MPRLKLLGVVVRNCSLVVVLTTSVSVSVAFSETFVAVSLTVALMTNLSCGPNPVTTVLRPESPNKRGLTEMSLQPLIYKEIKERKKEMKTLYVCKVWLKVAQAKFRTAIKRQPYNELVWPAFIKLTM